MTTFAKFGHLMVYGLIVIHLERFQVLETFFQIFCGLTNLILNGGEVTANVSQNSLNLRNEFLLQVGGHLPARRCDALIFSNCLDVSRLGSDHDTLSSAIGASSGRV